MRLAIWDSSPADFLVSGFTSGAVDNPFAIERHAPAACAGRFARGEADVALLPTVVALQVAESIDVVPSVGLVSWRYPFARLAWNDGLNNLPQTVAFNPNDVQERFLARVLLQEHYGESSEFVPYSEHAPRDLLETDEDATLLVGPNVPTLQVDGFSMDLGREWYELANYPMVWGLVCAHEGKLASEHIEALIACAEASEEHRDMWVQSQEPPAALDAFYHDDLRLRLDRLAIASLTEFRKYLFYYDVFDDIPDIPFAYLPDVKEKEDE